jgi:molybdopterin/thiamine biosynthesis adenylyltransferase
MNKFNDIKTVAIIGAGGIGCQILPIISLDYDIVLVDGDDYEPHNASRQFPALRETGNKAQVLAAIQSTQTSHKITPMADYLKGMTSFNNPAWGDHIDLIIGCVDNNASRYIISDLCMDMDIPGIICGNEEEMGEAHAILPDIYSPFEHHDFSDDTPAPFACNAQDNPSATQTSSANFMAAACAIHMMANWRSVDTKGLSENALIVHSRLDTRAQSHRTKLRDVLKEEAMAS